MGSAWDADLQVGPRRSVPRRSRSWRSRTRRWVGRVAIAIVGGTALVALVAAVCWPLTPSVLDAQRRIRERLAPHGATALAQLPSPDRVGQAVIATEDSRFQSHWGVDVRGLLRAALSFSSSGDAGGATLDQQLAKNLWTGDGGILTKAEQIELSLKLEAHYSKAQILRMYLSEVYFGHGFYGLTAATHGYFELAPDQVSWAQASLLGGLLQAPSAFDPYRHLDRAKHRQRHVLDRLVATHRLTRQQADTAFAAPLGLV